MNKFLKCLSFNFKCTSANSCNHMKQSSVGPWFLRLCEGVRALQPRSQGASSPRPAGLSEGHTHDNLATFLYTVLNTQTRSYHNLPKRN